MIKWSVHWPGGGNSSVRQAAWWSASSEAHMVMVHSLRGHWAYSCHENWKPSYPTWRLFLCFCSVSSIMVDLLHNGLPPPSPSGKTYGSIWVKVYTLPSSDFLWPWDLDFMTWGQNLPNGCFQDMFCLLNISVCVFSVTVCHSLISEAGLSCE